MLSDLFAIVAPVFVCAGIGYGWTRVGRAFETEFVTTLVTNIAAPCLVFHTLATLTVGGAAFATMAGAAVAALIVCGLVSAAVLKVAGLPLRSYLPPLMWPNTGNMGLPLNFLAFGEVGLGLAIAVFCVNSATHFTAGVAIVSGHASLRRLAQVPVLYAVAAALVFMASGTTPPAWITNTTKLLGGITIPTMLIALGVSLGRLGVQRLPVSLGLAMLRLALGFTVGVTLAWLLGLEGPARGVLIIQASMPAAVFNYLFAQRYGRSPEEVAGLVVLSTALSFATLPLLLWFVL
ncbi:MAG: AEC family transporter [Rhodospirillales bacterium]|nr:AEC family transporter [Rhodospirillales bacterium]